MPRVPASVTADLCREDGADIKGIVLSPRAL
jgi:hypothetical protein